MRTAGPDREAAGTGPSVDRHSKAGRCRPGPVTALPEHASDMDQQPPPWACHDALAFGWWLGWMWGGVDAYGGASGANPETRDGDSKAGRPSREAEHGAHVQVEHLPVRGCHTWGSSRTRRPPLVLVAHCARDHWSCDAISYREPTTKDSLYERWTQRRGCLEWQARTWGPTVRVALNTSDGTVRGPHSRSSTRMP